MQTYLEDLVELLLFQHSVFQVNSDFLLLTRSPHEAHLFVVVEVSRAEAFEVVEPAHHLHAGSVAKLTLHEELGVLATLRP